MVERIEKGVPCIHEASPSIDRLISNGSANIDIPQACVRRRSAVSVAANPGCPDRATAEQAVNEVWDSCFNDTRPFDEVYLYSDPEPHGR